MKKTIVLTLLLFINLSFSQEVINSTVEKSIFGIQTGILGVWIHNESKLNNNIALRTELGLDAGIFGGSIYPKTGYLMTPVITLEPRFYYNFKKRLSKNKLITKNSGNYLSLQTSFHPDWFTLSNFDNIEVENQISVIPTWGLKRTFYNHFTFETGIGLGFRHYFISKNSNQKENFAAINLNLKIGYTF